MRQAKKDREINKMLAIALPSILSWVGHMGYGIVDNLMIGKLLGSQALATSGIATSLYFTFLSFGMGVAGIIVSLISEASVKQKHLLSKIMQNSLLFTVSLGSLLFLLMFMFSPFFIFLLSNQDELNNAAILFIKILSPAPIFVMIFITFERLSEGLNKPKYAMYTVISCNIFNALLNYSLLTGSFGLPHLGLKGAAISTLTVNILEASIIILLCKKDKIIQSALNFKANYFCYDQIKNLARLGIPGGFFALAEMSIFSAGGFIAARISVYDIAAHQIISWIVGAVLIPIFGFGVATTVRIAYNKADEKPLLAFKIGLYSIIGSGIYMFISLFILWIFKYEVTVFLLKGNVNDKATIGLVISTFSVVLFGQIADSMQVMGSAALRGFKDTKSPLLFSIFSYWIIAIPLGYYLGVTKQLGVLGIWIGIGTGVTLQAIFIIIRLIKKFKPPLIII